MRLLEFEAKRLLAEAGLAIPRGGVAETAAGVTGLVEQAGPRVMVKAQARTGGRGKAGGILAADDPGEARVAAERLLGSRLRGEPVEAVVVEERLEPVAERYLGVLLDREAGRPAVLLGASGGVDVETAAQSGELASVLVDPLLGLADYQLRFLLNRAGLPLEQRRAVADALRRLYQVFLRYDLLLAEVNPLAVLADGRTVALDGRIEVDDNALFRQPELLALRRLDAVEAKVEAAGFHYVSMAGEVGLISTGSGACMALMDLLATHGLRPANFMELGQSMGTGGAQVATEILLDRPEVSAIMVAGYSGGPLERLAAGVLEVLRARPERQIPVVMSLQGRDDTAAMRLAAESGDPRVAAAAGYRAAVARVAAMLGRGGGSA